MIKYIAVEKDTPDVPRAWGEGKTDLVENVYPNCLINLISTSSKVLLPVNAVNIFALLQTG